MRFTRGDLPEPPPKGWDQLGIHPSYRTEFHPPSEITKLCRAAGVSPGDNNWNAKGFKACVDRKGRRVILPVGLDPKLERALLEHEGPHTWGVAHDDSGRNWMRRGKPVGPLTVDEAMQMRADAEAAMRYAQGDANAFAREAAARAPAVNPFSGK